MPLVREQTSRSGPPQDLQDITVNFTRTLIRMQIIGDPLTYAPALGVPLSYTEPRYAPPASLRAFNLQRASDMPDYQTWTPMQVLHAYDQLSGAPYTAATASIEDELLRLPLPEGVLLEYQLRILTLERWWDVKNAQQQQR
ncbi:MAG: hypothetical protein Q9211_004115 [Gyalolechia sp. 1 TL-2023]